MILTITDKSTDKEFDIVIRRIEMIRAERNAKSKKPKTDAEKIEALEKRVYELENKDIRDYYDNIYESPNTDCTYLGRPTTFTYTNQKGIVPAYRK